MRAGTMRDRVTLMRWSPVDDARFGEGGSWESIDTVWAGVTLVGGTEKFMNSGVQTEITHAIRMRYRADVTSKDRIIYRTNTLELVSVVDPDGRRRELVIMAMAYPAEGDGNG